MNGVGSAVWVVRSEGTGAMAKRLCLDPTAGASSDSSSSSAGASSSFDSASVSSSASSSGDYTLVCQCGYVTSVPHPLTRYFNFLGKTLICVIWNIDVGCTLKYSTLLSVTYRKCGEGGKLTTQCYIQKMW